jgi:hypothetical protein
LKHWVDRAMARVRKATGSRCYATGAVIYDEWLAEIGVPRAGCTCRTYIFRADKIGHRFAQGFEGLDQPRMSLSESEAHTSKSA